MGDGPVAGEEGEAQGDRDDADGAAASSRLRWTGVKLRFLGERCLNQDLGDLRIGGIAEFLHGGSYAAG